MGIFNKFFHKKQVQLEIGNKQNFNQKITKSKIERTNHHAEESFAESDIKTLLKSLNDNKPSIRAAAAEKLGNIGNTDALEQLLKALDDRSSFVRRAAANSLGNFKNNRVVESLIGALKDGYDDVRKAASNALYKIGNQAVEPLINSLENGNAIEITFKTLKRINPNWNDTQSGKLYTANLIFKMKDENPTVRQSAAEALGEIGEKQTAEVLCTALKDREWQVRSAAARALGKIKEVISIDPLISCLTDEDYRVRLAAADALGHLRDARSINPLIACFKDEEWQVSFNAEEALKKIGALAIEPLVACLSEIDLSAREKAAELLDKLGDNRGREALKIIRQQQEQVHKTKYSFTQEELDRIDLAMGEMYYDCPHCGHYQILGNLAKALYKTNPFEFKERECVSCGKTFNAAARMKFGKCPESASGISRPEAIPAEQLEVVEIPMQIKRKQSEVIPNVKVPCEYCGRMISSITADNNGGICSACFREQKSSGESDSKMLITTRIACEECGRMILPIIAQRYSGRCESCYHPPQKVNETTVPTSSACPYYDKMRCWSPLDSRFSPCSWLPPKNYRECMAYILFENPREGREALRKALGGRGRDVFLS